MDSKHKLAGTKRHPQEEAGVDVKVLAAMVVADMLAKAKSCVQKVIDDKPMSVKEATYHLEVIIDDEPPSLNDCVPGELRTFARLHLNSAS